MRKIVVLMALFTLVSSVGCSKNNLSKEDAKVLLADVTSSVFPTCSIDGEITLIPYKTKGGFGYTDAAWGQFANDLGFITDHRCSDGRCTGTEQAPGKCEGGEDALRLEMRGRRPPQKCTLKLLCGHSELEVDSVVTEGPRATIRYSLKPTVDPKFKAAESKAPAESKFRISGAQVEQRSAVAVRTDDGKWILGK